MRCRLVVVTAALALLALAGSVSAAPFAGTVVDAETLEPVAKAKITVTASADPAAGQAAVVGVVVTASAAGVFTFADVPVGALQYRVEADGFEPSDETVIIGAAGTTEHVIALLRVGIEGERIEIRVKKPTPEPIGKQQLDRREISRIAGTRGDALQSIKSLPGVGSVDAPGAGPGLLVIRGSAPEDSTVAIDGIEIPLLYHFFGLQSVLPTEFIESIDFLPGGFGAERGRSTGGTIEVNTRDKKIVEWGGFAELSFINIAGLVQGPLSQKHDVQLTAAVRRSAIDLVLPLVLPEDSGINFTTAPTYYDGQVRVDYFPKPAHRLSAFALGSFDLLTLLNENINPNEPLATNKFENTTSFGRVIGTWAFEGDKMSNRLAVSAGIGGFGFNIGTDRFLDLDNRRIEVREDFRYAPLEKLQLRAGAEARASWGHFESVLPLPPSEGSGNAQNFSLGTPAVRDFDYTNHVAAAYVAADIRPIDKTTVTPGVRVDYYERMNAATVSPRLQLRHVFTNQFTAKFSLGHYTRPLQQAEAFQTNLDPERATQYVLGGAYTIMKGLTAESSLFYTDRRLLAVQDQFLRDADPDNAYISRGIGRSYGGEALIRARMGDFFGWIAYTISRSERIDDPLAKMRLFDFDQTHNFLIVSSYKLGTWEFSGRWQYTTGVPETPIIGSTFIADANIYIPELGDINSARLPSHHQLDLRIDKKFDWESIDLSLYLDVTNVYANPATFGYFYNFDFSEREAVQDLPITPALGIRGTM